jgi:outer membrane protein W
MLGENASINLDLKYIQIETDVDAVIEGSSAPLGTVEVNPFVFGVGFGYHF